MTLEQFERGYARRSDVTVEWLHARNQFGVPCDCEEPGCKGWQMKHIEERNENQTATDPNTTSS